MSAPSYSSFLARLKGDNPMQQDPEFETQPAAVRAVDYAVSDLDEHINQNFRRSTSDPGTADRMA